MKKRVLHLLASNKYSGAENVACSIIKNTNVDAFYCSPSGPIEESLKAQDIKYIELEKFNPSCLKKVVKDNNIDIVHAHDFKASFIASFLPKNIKVVSHIHCHHKEFLMKTIVSTIYPMVSNRFNKIIVVSNEILDNASFKKKIEDKTVVLTNVVDPNKVIKNSEKFETEKYDLVFCGRLTEVKRPLMFIEIVKELKNIYPEIKVCIIGNGDLFDACKEAIQNNNLEDNIELLGFQSNPFPYIKNSKIAVLTSSTEGLPMSVIECLILDTPVVHTGVGGLGDLYINHKNYICNTEEEFAEVISIMLDTDLKKYKKDCKALIKDCTDINGYSRKIEKIYKGL